MNTTTTPSIKAERIARIDTLQARREELHRDLHSATLRAFSAEDYAMVARLAKQCSAVAAEIEMLNDSL